MQTREPDLYSVEPREDVGAAKSPNVPAVLTNLDFLLQIL